MSSAAHPLPETPFPLTPHEEKVRAQVRLFEAALPELMVEHAGRWAVWLDGLKHVADAHVAARDWARANLAAGSGYVVTRVAERRPADLSAARWSL